MRRKKKGVLKYSLLLDKQPISYIYIYLILYVYIYIYIFRIRRREMFRNIFLILDGIVIRIRRNVQKERRRILDKQPIVILYIYFSHQKEKGVSKRSLLLDNYSNQKKSRRKEDLYIYFSRQKGMFRNVTFRWIGRKERPEGVDEQKGGEEENNSSGISLLDNKTSSPPQYIYRRVILPFLLMKSRGCG